MEFPRCSCIFAYTCLKSPEFRWFVLEWILQRLPGLVFIVPHRSRLVHLQNNRNAGIKELRAAILSHCFEPSYGLSLG